MARIHETALQTTKPNVTFEQILETGVIPNTKIIGNESANKRKYGPAVLNRDRLKYEGAKVYINHPRRSEVQEDRDLRDWVGVLEGIESDSDGGLRASQFRLRKEGKHFREIAEAATKFWQDFGLSHVADCDFKKVDGFDVVESINEVFSVDLVADPGATKGLFESRDTSMKTKKVTVKGIVESASESAPLRKVLMEMVTRKALANETEVTVSESATADEQINAAVAAALMAETPEARKSAADTLAAQPTQETPGATGTAAESDRLKSIEAKLAVSEAKTLLLESGREATEIRVKTLAATAESDRKALLESWPKKDATARESRPFDRPGQSPPASGSGEGDGPSKAYESRWVNALKRAESKLAKAN